MRKLLAALAIGVIVACGGDSGGGTGPEAKGSILFRLDAQSCTGSGTLLFFVDGQSVGTQTLSAGSTSQAFSVSAGQHMVGARESIATGYVWPTQSAVVPSGGTYTHLLICT